ncbi:MAG TPA: bifunctional glycosyltransferase family 2 protein/CDP-glycerol:glycerophosphate glycerophosphotransferase [Streptosporangiaceae bacterium]|nr:bifunctional glycosyltransferase family 2 protein/CDP-glycerol:glycerophosphate glycerophosphotransferase [Streptosporangiaceae bacterium]
MTVPRISVVVPFYNNVDLLGECLASIAAQTITDLQVIMVDDGSTDGSSAAASAHAADDPRFTLVSVPNGGPGSARNHGVAAATGEFLAFVDADDVLPPDAYATMLGVLERSGSDFVSGAVRRLSAAGLGESGLHARAIKARRLGTHISRTPELFYDISVWNKLFRRSFWDASGLAFPEGMLWEDLVAMTRAHVLARAVDVITEPVYHWRDRDQGAPSITQSRTDISNFSDRITALEMIDDFLRERGTPAMLRQHQHKALINDLWLYIGDLCRTSADYRSEFIGLARRYLGQVNPKVTSDLPAEHKLAYYLIGQDKAAELAEYAGWLAAHPGRTPPMVRTFRGRRADLPFRRDRGLAIPDRVFRPLWRELDPYVRVDGISWRDDGLVITGCAYIPSVDIGRRRHTTKLVVLVPSGRRLPVLLPARSVRHPEATPRSGQDRYSYEWAGFRCEISPRWLRAGRRLRTADWDCFVVVRARAVVRPARLHTPGPAAEHPAARQIAPGLTFGARWAGRRLRLQLRRDGQSPPAGAPEPDAAPRSAVPAAPAPSAGPASSAGSSEPVGSAAPAGRAQPGEVPMVTEQTWSKDGRLVLHGSLSQASPGNLEIVLRRRGGLERHVIPADRQGDRFSAAIAVGALDVFGERLPLPDGRWDIMFRCPVDRLDPGADADPLAGADRDLTSDGLITARPARLGRKIYRCASAAAPAARPESASASMSSGTGLLLDVGSVLRFAERGRIRRRLLREVYYRIQRRLPCRDAILFISFKGKQCGDSPRGIADELRRRDDAREHIWAVRDWSVLAPDGASAVLIGTQEYYAALGRCSFVVANDHMPRPFRKRAGQRYVQTWHGTPLKRIGYDIGEPRFASGTRYFDYLARDVAQWDLLLSPNPFSTPIMRQAFRFTGEICESGYPRNDALLAGQAAGQLGGDQAAGTAGRAAEVRRRLGLPPGRRVAMYVPTWRDDQSDDSGQYRLDFRLDLDAARRRLGSGYVLLIRGHHLMASGLPAVTDPGFTLDVTGYPDIADLLLVTDVLITDYSSVMFDFAPTGRPMLFFTYDLEQYRDQVRGFYLDFDALAPGPLLATSDQVITALADLDAVAARYRAAHAAFTARFCPLDDGNASARACDRIFGD